MVKESLKAFSRDNEEVSMAGLGTFSGVFTPSVLTILGVIMYLRLGWVVGNVGLLGTLLIVTLASSITFLTALSVSAIATDQKVRGGGAYYMISRALGIEAGGAVGIPLYIAQAFSVPLYTIGFAESVALSFPGINQRTVGFAITILIAALALKSTRIVIKAQYLIMAAIAVSLLSLFLGSGTGAPAAAPTIPGAGAQPGFWLVFAVFFPAVTGIMAGINMSGDLKNPAKSIPLGTLAAIGTGYVIYMALPVLLYMRASTEELLQNPMVMYGMARWGGLILLGIWGATLSSAIGSILGAPRVLQALARDKVLPRGLLWLGKGSGAYDEPRLGTLLTLVFALILIAVGNLNVIAPILTMFFLTTYMVLNLSAGIEGFLKNPSFRPAFRVHWGFSFAGALGCIAVMFLINALATVAAAAFVAVVYIWLQRRRLESTWGDVRRGLWMMLVRAGLLQLDRAPDQRNWRPNILVLSGAPTRRWHLIEFADMLTHRKGMFTVATVLPYDSKNAQQKIGLETAIKDYLDKRGVPALVKLISAPDIFSGAERLAEVYGLGAVVPNTLLLGNTESGEEEIKKKYFKLVEEIYRGGKNVLILNQNLETPLDREPLPKQRRKIDVWWGGLEGNGGLMLILADSMRLDTHWSGALLRLKMVVPNETAALAVRQNLDSLLGELNIDAEYDVIESQGRAFDVIFREYSGDADIIFHGLAAPGKNFPRYYSGIQGRLDGMPTTVLVLAGQGTSYAGIIKKE